MDFGFAFITECLITVLYGMNYQNGKIYKITANMNEEEGDIYIGSTTQALSKRMVEHRKGYKQWINGKRTLTTSYKLFQKYGIENCVIVLLENVCCQTKEELVSREAFFIRTCPCVNKQIPDRTKEEYRQQHLEITKQKRDNNKDIKSQKAKEYYEANKEIIKEKSRQYHLKKKAEKAPSNK